MCDGVQPVLSCVLNSKRSVHELVWVIAVCVGGGIGLSFPLRSVALPLVLVLAFAVPPSVTLLLGVVVALA